MAVPRYTIMIVPSSPDGDLRRFGVSSRFLSFVFIGLALLAVASTGTMLHYYNLYRTAKNVTEVQQENESLKYNLEQSQVLTHQLNRKIKVLTRLSARLKSMAGVPQVAGRKAPRRAGMGGVTMGSVFDPQSLMILKRKAELLEKNLIGLHEYFSNPLNRVFTPANFPSAGFISSPFGMRRNPFTNEPDFHQGVDICNEPGTPVTATANGIVAYAGTKGSFGLTVELEHEKDVSTLFGHLQRIAVEPGQTIRRGQVIGYMGNSGKSTGPHLHYEVHVKRQPVNPRTYLNN